MSFIYVRATHRWFPVLVLVCATTTGCIKTDVKISDGGSTLITGTVVKRLDSLKFGTRIPVQGGIEVGYESQSGTGTQWLPSPEYVTLDQSLKGSYNSGSLLDPKLTIIGPQTIKSTASTGHGHIAYNHLIKFSRSLELEPILGLSYDKASIKVLGLSDGKELSISPHALGFIIGVIPRWKFNEHFSLDGRVRGGISGDGDYTFLFNPTLVFNVSHTVFLSAGYIERHQYFKTKNASDFYFDFSGPSAAIKIEF